MDKQQILQIAKSDPRFSQGVLAAENQVGDMPITSEGLDKLVQMLEFAINNPQQYAQIREAAVKDNYVDAGDLPAHFDMSVLISVLIMLYGMQERMHHKTRQGYARGGLAQAAKHLASQGRNGDTMLAHINPQEARLLEQHGGGGTRNPVTGLTEYFSLKKFLGAVIPIAIAVFAPYLAPAIGAAMGASGAAAGMIGGAVIGGASAALTGGNAAQGALFGGLGGGLGNAVGGAASDALGMGLGDTAKGVLGSGLVGGVAGAATGQGFGKGALQGAAGSFIGNQVGGLGETGTALGTGLQEGGKQFGNMMAAGYDPKTALLGGGLSGLAAGMLGSGSAGPQKADSNVGMKPSDIVLQGLQAPAAPNGLANLGMDSFQPDYSLSSASNTPAAPAPGMNAGDLGTGVSAPSDQSAPAASKTAGGGLSLGKLAGLLPLASLLGGNAPPAAQQAVQSLSPSQQEYFNRPSVTWDWGRMQQDANKSNMSLAQYMSQNWNQVAGGAYNQPAATQTVKLASGGMARLSRMVAGQGSGRDDAIPADLSDGEYVFDAETVAMLGDGSNKEGARRLDEMRRAIRQQKGKALAKGQISPNAKSPLAYLKGAA